MRYCRAEPRFEEGPGFDLPTAIAVAAEAKPALLKAAGRGRL